MEEPQMAQTVDRAKVGSVFDLPGKSVRIVKENWQMFAVVNILALLSALFAIPDSNNNDGNDFGKYGYDGTLSGVELASIIGGSFIIAVIIAIAAIFFYALATSLELRSARGEKPEFKTLFEDGKKYWLRLFGLTILSALMILGGLILLIIPGLIVIGRIIFAPYVMFEKDLSITKSLKASNEMSKGNAGLVWAAIGMTISLAIIANLFSYIPYIGPLLTTVIAIAVSLIVVLRYFEMKKAIVATPIEK